MKALLLAGGQASRLAPFTKTRSKTLLPLANKTILRRNLRALSKAGINDIVIVHDVNDDLIAQEVEHESLQGMNIDLVKQESEGIGKAILSGRSHFIEGQYFVLVYGDILSNSNIFSHLLSVFNRLHAPVASVCLVEESTHRYGNVYLNEEMKISQIVEKPEDESLGNYVLGGVFVMPYELFPMVEKTQSMETALGKLVDKEGIYAAIWEHDWFDINYPWSILQANRMMMKSLTESRIAEDVKIPSGVSINGPVIIKPEVTICEGAVINGPAIIGKGSFIGHNALVREYCALGPNTLIGFGTELKNCVIFGDAIVGRISYIGDSVVGQGAHIGSGTMTVNYPVEEDFVPVMVQGELKNTNLRKLGAFIGDGANIGASNTIQAGAVIDAWSVIPDHFTVSRGEK